MNLTLDETTLRYAFVGTSFSWNWDTSYVPHLVVEGKQVEFAKAGSIVHQDFSTGLGHGIKSVFRDFKEYPDLAFETASRALSGCDAELAVALPEKPVCFFRG